MDGDSSMGQLRSVYTTGGLFFIAVALSDPRVPVSNSNIPVGSPHWIWMESFLCTVVALSMARRHGFASQEKSHSRFQHRNPWKAFKSQSPTRSSWKAGYLSICLLVRKTVKPPPPTSCLDEALSLSSCLITAMLLDPSSGHIVGASGHEMKKSHQNAKEKKWGFSFRGWFFLSFKGP